MILSIREGNKTWLGVARQGVAGQDLKTSIESKNKMTEKQTTLAIRSEDLKVDIDEIDMILYNKILTETIERLIKKISNDIDQIECLISGLDFIVSNKKLI